MFPMEVNAASIRCWQGRLEVTPEGLARDQGFFVKELGLVLIRYQFVLVVLSDKQFGVPRTDVNYC